MIYVEILVRRPDGTVIVRLVGDACQALIWDAPAWGPIVAGPGEPHQLAGVAYTPSLVDDAGKALPAGRLVDPSPPAKDRPQIKQLVCKRCGCPIDTGLCGYGCEFDSTQASERDPHQMEVRVYEFIGVEPLQAARVDPSPPSSKESL